MTIQEAYLRSLQKNEQNLANAEAVFVAIGEGQISTQNVISHLVRDAGRAAAGGMGAAGHITEHGLHAGAQVSAKDQVGIIIKHSGSTVIVPLVSDDVGVIIIAGFWQRLGGQQIPALRFARQIAADTVRLPEHEVIVQ